MNASYRQIKRLRCTVKEVEAKAYVDHLHIKSSLKLYSIKDALSVKIFLKQLFCARSFLALKELEDSRTKKVRTFHWNLSNFISNVNITRLTSVVGSIVFLKNTAKKLVIQCLSRLHLINVKRHQQRDEARLWMVR